MGTVQTVATVEGLPLFDSFDAPMVVQSTECC